MPEQQKRPGAKGSVTFTPGVQGEPLLRQHDLFWHWSEKQQSSEVWQLPSLGGTQGRQPLTGPTPTQCLSQQSESDEHFCRLNLTSWSKLKLFRSPFVTTLSWQQY